MANSFVCRFPEGDYWCRVNRIHELFRDGSVRTIGFEFEAQGDGSLGDIQSAYDSLLYPSEGDPIPVSSCEFQRHEPLHQIGLIKFELPEHLLATTPYPNLLHESSFRFGSRGYPRVLIPSFPPARGSIVEIRRQEFFDEFGIHLPRNLDEVDGFVSAIIRMDQERPERLSGGGAEAEGPITANTDARFAEAGLGGTAEPPGAAAQEIPEETASQEPSPGQPTAHASPSDSDHALSIQAIIASAEALAPDDHGVLPVMLEQRQREAANQHRQQHICVICLMEPVNATFVHGNSGHTCCCYNCATTLGRRRPTCPICRAPIERVIYNFYS